MTAIFQNKFIREAGTVIDSSLIISCKYTDDVNSQTNLTVGDTTASVVDVEVRNPNPQITSGEKLTYYQIEDGVETLIGTFYAEAPTIASKVSVRFIAYDVIAKLEVDFSDWLSNNQSRFPMTLRSLTNYACNVAGITLSAESFPNEDISIPAFYANGITARKIVSWVAQLAGCFVRGNADGQLEFAWYQETSVTISGLNKSTTFQYMQDSLYMKSYQTDLIQRIQFKQAEDDVGVIYPEDADGNVFAISRNGIAAQLDKDTLTDIAQTLYEKLSVVTYTPLECTIKRTSKIKAGDIVSVTDGNGNTVNTYVMKVYSDASGTVITSTGDQNYADKAAVASEEYNNIPGKMLSLQKDVDGLRIENKDTAGKVASLELNVDGINTQVSMQSAEIDSLRTELTRVEQTETQISAAVKSIEENGVSKVTTETGATLDKDGLHITKSGEEMESRIDYSGLHVERDDVSILEATADGVEAENVKVRTYLIVGKHARFEDYANDRDSNRTACFFI